MLSSRRTAKHRATFHRYSASGRNSAVIDRQQELPALTISRLALHRSQLRFNKMIQFIVICATRFGKSSGSSGQSSTLCIMTIASVVALA